MILSSRENWGSDLYRSRSYNCFSYAKFVLLRIFLNLNVRKAKRSFICCLFPSRFRPLNSLSSVERGVLWVFDVICVLHGVYIFTLIMAFSILKPTFCACCDVNFFRVRHHFLGLTTRGKHTTYLSTKLRSLEARTSSYFKPQFLRKLLSMVTLIVRIRFGGIRKANINIRTLGSIKKGAEWGLNRGDCKSLWKLNYDGEI